MLKRKAEQGVKIYVVVYKEVSVNFSCCLKSFIHVFEQVTQTMTMSSHHTKVSTCTISLRIGIKDRCVQATLDGLHPNIACMRHPDHIGSKGKCIELSHQHRSLIRMSQTTSRSGPTMRR